MVAENVIAVFHVILRVDKAWAHFAVVIGIWMVAIAVIHRAFFKILFL